MNNKAVRNLSLFATAFALVVVVLGAFTRLSDAGLGCPDWPGCYGFMHIPTKDHHIEAANQAFPDQPYEFAKAWPEMVHRYFAGTLGLLVLALSIISWRNKQKLAMKHSSFLLVLIIFQAALGMWTVTMKLHPLIVMLHLMGGFMTFSLLASLTARYHFQFSSPLNQTNLTRLKKLVVLTLSIVVLQVALGGWTSANYAAMVCHELPICQGNWLNDGDFLAGFQLWGREAETYEFGILDQNARIAIHAAHRIGAIVATLTLCYLIFALVRQQSEKLLSRFGWILAILLIVQIVLGVNNILFQLPLMNAVAHNGVGALLVVTLVCLLTLILMPQKIASEGNNNE
ncbi:COX15/CtaA family protein [Aliikangiella coralliicola]|uniref:Heme A synthase n=1 Tax=Aliikangiella coralliicola TaxID=2592383 RepID=A0A545UH71_9GAMM|nr:COX15/CtaA family protein [Aliikangiella coralliicola]TQV88808.1 heme A synthase [Aliikangiella coralliicola]